MLRIACGLCLMALDLSAQTRIAVRGDAWVIAAVEQPVSVSVQVLDAEGAPRAGVPLVFARPGTPAALDRVTTNEEGVAEITFTTPASPGPFPVEVLAEREDGSAMIAVTVTGDGLPIVDAASARARMGEGRLQGPYLLPAGAAIATGPGTETRTVPAPTWIAWEDFEVTAGYEHPVRIHLVNGDNPDAPVDTFEDKWWPSVRLAEGGRFVSLRGWRDSPVDRAFAASLSAELPGSLMRGVRTAVRQAVEEEPNACAIIIYGTAEYWQTVDEDRAYDFFTDEKKLLPENIFRNLDADGNPQPVSPEKIDELTAAALAKGCTRLYLVVIGHGRSGLFVVTKDTPPTGNPAQDFAGYSYTTLAGKAKAFTDQGIPVTTIIMACQSGSAIPEFHKAGVEGEIYTSSDAASLTRFHYFLGSYFIWNFFEGWASDSADYNGDGKQSSDEAFEYSIKESSRTAQGNPQSADIAKPSPVNISNVWIDLGDAATNPGTIVVPRPRLTAGDCEVIVTLENPAIASFAEEPGTFRAVIPAGQSEVRIPVQGKTQGRTRSLVTVRDQQRKEWTGSGLVTVGAYEISSSEVRVNVDETANIPVRRAPRLASQPGNGNLTAISPDANCLDVARVEAEAPSNNWREAILRIYGRRPGSCDYTMLDSNRDSFTVPVRVNGYSPLLPYIDGTSNVLLFRELGDLGEQRVRITRQNTGQNTIIKSFPDEVIFPAGSRQIDAAFGCGATGETTLIATDSRGASNPMRFVCPSSAAEARAFAATPPFAYFQIYDAMIAEVGWRNGTGQLLPYHPFRANLALADGSVRFIDPNRVATSDAMRSWMELNRRDWPSGNYAAVDVRPNGSEIVHTNAEGFARVLFLASKEGTYNLTFQSGTLPPINYPIRVVPRLAPPPDELVVLPLPTSIRVGQEITLTTQINRGQRPLQDAIVTLMSRNSNIRFLDGTVTTSGTTTQQRTGAPGRSIVRFRVQAAGPVDMIVVSGAQVAEVKATANP